MLTVTADRVAGDQLMPVFRCASCGRLLYRPGNLLGRAWQCFTCGPTRVSDAAVDVGADLAALLEREYRLSISGSPDISAVPPGDESGGGPPTSPLWPAPVPRFSDDERRELRQRLTVSNKLPPSGVALVALIVLLAVALILGGGAVVSMSWEDYLLRVAMVAMIVGPALAATLVLIAVVVGAITRWQRLRGVDERLRTTLPPGRVWPTPPDAPADADGRVQRKDDSVSPPAERD
jgi:hypothetical protein